MTLHYKMMKVASLVWKSIDEFGSDICSGGTIQYVPHGQTYYDEVLKGLKT